jgi:hypothetical protein
MATEVSGSTTSPAIAQLVPSAVTQPVPYAQLQQQNALNKAIAAVHLVTSAVKKAVDMAKGLMPQWMLAMGNAYLGQERMNSVDGDMGKFEEQLNKEAAVEQGFAKAIQSLGSFSSLKCFLAAEDQAGGSQQWENQDSVSGMTKTIMNEINGFVTNGENDAQNQTQYADEYNIVVNQAQSIGGDADDKTATIKSTQSQGADIQSGEGNISDALSEINQDIGRVMNRQAG